MSQEAQQPENSSEEKPTSAMEEEVKQAEIEKLQASVREAMETAEDVREEVRRLTMEALAEGKLDASQVRSVIQAVIEGASSGMESHGPKARAALEEAIKGLEDGLIKAAEATKLALEEAASRTQDFTEQEVKQAVDQLFDLERHFVDVLTELAQKGSEQAQETLGDLARHARNSGTAIGEYMGEVMESLPKKLQEAGEWGFKAGVETARNTGAQLAAITSGFLAGLADVLDRQAKKLKQDKS